jgi:hypothetical protein
MTNVTYATNCWEKDWYYILNDSRLKKIIDNNSYDFDYRLLIINNVKEDTVKPLLKAIDHAIKIGAFTDFYFVNDHYEEALDAISLKRSDIDIGYNYSISEWVAIHLCKTKYITYYMGDSIVDSNHDWITPSIKLLEDNENIKVANPLWSYRHNEAMAESVYELKDFYIGHGFSDQCFLVRKEDFYADIYKEYHPDQIRYPVHAGDCFERRVYSWMRNKQVLRATYKHCSYIHKNWDSNIRI